MAPGRIKMCHVAAAAPQGPPVKKARVAPDPPTDPVTAESVRILVEAFDDADQVGLLNMPPLSRQMLQAGIPFTLGGGSAKDERHSYQTQVANAIGQVFIDVVKASGERAAVELELIESAAGAKGEKEEAISAAKLALEARGQEVEKKRAELDAAKQALTTAVSNATAAEEDAKNYAVELGLVAKQEEVVEAKAVLTDCFDILKACGASAEEGTESLLGPVETALKKLEMDDSLVNAGPSALGKNPEDRGEFDKMVVNQLEEYLRQHVQNLERCVSSFDTPMAEKKAAVTDAKAAIDQATAHVEQYTQSVESAEKDQRDCEVAVRSAEDALKLQEQRVCDAQAQQSSKQALHQKSQDLLATFRCLYDRVQVQPPAAETPADSAEALTGAAVPMSVGEPAAAEGGP